MQPMNRGFENKISWESLKEGNKHLSPGARAEKFKVVLDAASREYRCSLQPMVPDGMQPPPLQVMVHQ